VIYAFVILIVHLLVIIKITPFYEFSLHTVYIIPSEMLMIKQQNVLSKERMPNLSYMKLNIFALHMYCITDVDFVFKRYVFPDSQKHNSCIFLVHAITYQFMLFTEASISICSALNSAWNWMLPWRIRAKIHLRQRT
jgi:hypothetical protein